MPTWYNDSFFLLHYEHPYVPSEQPPPLTGFDPAQLRRVLEQVRPDAVHYTVKGPAGFVPYPTQYRNALYSVEEEPATDLLRSYREITGELGIRLVLGYSGLVDHRAANWRSDWQRTKSDYLPYPTRALCPNSGYVEELLLPQLEEIVARYSPDGIWMDAENWTVAPCYCTVCTTEFQMLHGRSAPVDRTDSFWPEWLAFQRESFQRYVTRVGRFLHDHAPELVYASNGGWATHQPDEVPAGPDRLTWDLSPAFAARQAGLEARFFDSRRLPFDLLTWAHASARPWPQGRLPALPSYPKSIDHLCQDGAVILANGGRWTVGLTPYSDDALPESQHATVARAAEWARERREWCAGTESTAYVAVLHSAATHRRAGNGLYDPGPSLDRIRGAHQALLELHHPHDVLNEDALPRELDRYRLVVLPEQSALTPATETALTEWVQAGGRVLATGMVAPRIMEDVPTFGLEELLGVRWTGRQEPEGFVLHEGLPLRIAAPVYHVAAAGAETLVPLLTSGHEARHQSLGNPAVSRNVFGSGEAVYVAADLFTAYHRSQYPGLRNFLREVLTHALPDPPLVTDAPPTVEIVLRTKDDRLLVHLVNHAPGKSLAQNSAFIERVPLTEAFSLTLALNGTPAAVRMQPTGEEPEYTFAEGALTVAVPPFHLHAVVEVLMPEEADEG